MKIKIYNFDAVSAAVPFIQLIGNLLFFLCVQVSFFFLKNGEFPGYVLKFVFLQTSEKVRGQSYYPDLLKNVFFFV